MPLMIIKEHRLLDRQDSFLKKEPLTAWRYAMFMYCQVQH